MVASVWKQFWSDGKAHKDAAIEVVAVIPLSILPLFVVSFSRKLSGYNTHQSWSDVIYSMGSSGELALYTLSLFGTLVWLSFLKGGASRLILPRKILGIMVLPAAILLSVWVSNITGYFSLSPKSVTGTFIIYLVAVITYYALLVLCELTPPEVETQLSKNADDLSDRARDHIG